MPSREGAGEIPQPLGWLPNSPGSQGRVGDGATDAAQSAARGGRKVGLGDKPGRPSPLLCPHLFHSRTRFGRLTIPHRPLLFFFLPCPLAPGAL